MDVIPSVLTWSIKSRNPALMSAILDFPFQCFLVGKFMI